MTFEEALAHVGSAYNSEAVKQSVLGAIPHYIWTRGTGKHKTGYCTACNEQIEKFNELPEWVANDPYVVDEEEREAAYETESYLTETTQTEAYQDKVSGKSGHKHYGWCPLCGARIQYRSLKMGHKQVIDKIFLIYYSKSEIEDGAICCVGYYVDADWKNASEADAEIRADLFIEPDEVCVFRPGTGGSRFINETIWNGKKWCAAFMHRKKCISGYCPGTQASFGASRRYTVLDKTAYMKAITGGKRHYEKILLHEAAQKTEAAKYYDKITLLQKVTRYPHIEYLLRIGLCELAGDVIDKNLGNVLNFRARTAKKVLRLTDEQWGEVKSKRIGINAATLMFKDYAKTRGWDMSMEQLHQCGKKFNAERRAFLTALSAEMQPIDDLTAVKYIGKHDLYIGDYIDYLRQLKLLTMPLDAENLYPKNFQGAHTKLSKRIQIKKNEHIKKSVRERAAALTRFCFSACGLVIRPMQSVEEIINEGTELCHCVGGYAERYAKGDTILCALREESAPETPLYTVEFRTTGEMAQCRGYKNNIKPEDEERLAEFWRLFKAMQAELKKQADREAKTIKKEKKARKAA